MGASRTCRPSWEQWRGIVSGPVVGRSDHGAEKPRRARSGPPGAVRQPAHFGAAAHAVRRVSRRHGLRGHAGEGRRLHREPRRGGREHHRRCLHAAPPGERRAAAKRRRLARGGFAAPRAPGRLGGLCPQWNVSARRLRRSERCSRCSAATAKPSWAVDSTPPSTWRPTPRPTPHPTPRRTLPPTPRRRPGAASTRTVRPAMQAPSEIGRAHV